MMHLVKSSIHWSVSHRVPGIVPICKETCQYRNSAASAKGIASVCCKTR